MKVKLRTISLILCVVMVFTWLTPMAHATTTRNNSNLVHEEKIIFNEQEYNYEIYANGAYLISTVSEDGQVCSLTLDSEGNGTFKTTDEVLVLDINELSEDNVDVSIQEGNINLLSLDSEVYHIGSFEQLSSLANGTINTREFISVSVISLSTLLYIIVEVALAVVVLGVSYIALSSLIDTLTKEAKEDKHYYYYKAYTAFGLTDVYINFVSGGIKYNEAVDRIYYGDSIYTFSAVWAREVVRAAGLGIVGPEIDSNMKTSVLYYYHFHTGDRNGAHAWYGLPHTA